MKVIKILILSSALVGFHAGADDVLPMTPGLWETTVTSTNSFTGTQTNTQQECIVEDHFNPKKFAEGSDECELTESDVDGNTLTFTMACTMQGGSATMTGSYTVDGDEGSGTMNMEGSFGGQTMTMESEMTAQRIGDC